MRKSLHERSRTQTEDVNVSVHFATAGLVYLGGLRFSVTFANDTLFSEGPRNVNLWN